MQTHIVKATETLWKIGRRYGRTVAELAQANHLKGKQIHWLRIDQVLIIPDKGEAPPDTILKVKFGGLDHKGFTPKKVKVEHDGNTVEHVLDELGMLPLTILDHAQGLKIWIEDLTKKMVPVMHQPILPLGKWNVAVDSRTVAIKGNLQPKKGPPATTTAAVKTATTHNAQQTGGTIAVEQTRAEAGKPVHALATIYTEENLRLSAGNEPFRAFIIAAAKKHGLTPQSLAALINAEARSVKGTWQADSNAGHPKLAQGLCQFFPAAWQDVFKCSSSLIHAECQGLSPAALLGKRLNARYAIDAGATFASENLKNFGKAVERDVNALLPEDKAKLAYLLHHDGLKGVERLIGLHPALSEPDARKLLALQLGKDMNRVDQWVRRYDGNVFNAYKGWLYSYIDSKITVGAFLVQDEQKFATPPRGIETILSTINQLAAVPKPAPRTRAARAATPAAQAKAPPVAAKPVTAPVAAKPVAAPVAAKPAATPSPAAPAPATAAPAQAATLGNDSIWHDPLATCTIRTAGMATINSAKFNGQRHYKGKTSHHQGLDLIAAPGTPIFAVADGRVVHCTLPPGSAYGKAIILEVSIHDLAPHQLAQCQLLNPGEKKIGFFYAHLSERLIDHDTPVTAGTVIGKTGCSGNASSMTTIAKGAHLHLEVRKKPLGYGGKGIENRINPLPFLHNCTND